jgi:four helix bundle protein
MARKLENLKIYNLSYDFVIQIYKILKKLPQSEERNIFSQLQRASTSIVLNIAEGSSNVSNRVFFNHLQYSYGSCKEVKVLLRLCLDLEYISSDNFLEIIEKLEELTASLFKFMEIIQNKMNERERNYKFNYKNIFGDANLNSV